MAEPGDQEATLFVRMSVELRDAITEAARREDLMVSQWIRKIARERTKEILGRKVSRS